jgi:AAA domain
VSSCQQGKLKSALIPRSAACGAKRKTRLLPNSRASPKLWYLFGGYPGRSQLMTPDHERVHHERYERKSIMNDNTRNGRVSSSPVPKWRPNNAIEMAEWAASLGMVVVKGYAGSRKAKGSWEPWAGLEWRDPATVRRVFSAHDRVGIKTGNGFVYDDLDVDDEGNPAGDWNLEELCAAVRRELPRTFTLATPSGGTGLLWRATPGRTFKSAAGSHSLNGHRSVIEGAPYIDVRGDGGLFVLYDPARPTRLVTDDRVPVPMPWWLAELHPERGAVTGEVADIPDTRAWLVKYGDGELCDEMAGTLDKWLDDLERGDTPHDAMVGATNSLIGDCVAGHSGLNSALAELRVAYFAAMRGKSRESEKVAEWRSAIAGAIGMKVGKRGKPRRTDPCDVGSVADLEGFNPLQGRGLVKSLSGLRREMVRWLWPGYLAFHELTQMDGEKGQGKTFLTDDVTARATRGLPMPCYEDAVCDPINVLILTDEGHAESTVLPRLEAAGADLDRVFIPDIKVERGRAPELLLLPRAAHKVGEMIRAANAGLVIWDPITDFLEESIQSHNDASVRRALRPMGIELHKHICAGLALRHMNQNRSQDAKYRGSGSGAFQNRARVHLVTGEIPTGFPGGGQFGLAMVDNNIMPRVRGSLAYSIVDSDIQGDDQGNMVGRVEWHGLVDIDANTLTRTENRPGPEAHEQNAIRAVLAVMFDEKDTWRQKEIIAKLKEENCSTNDKTLEKVKKAMGIRSAQVFKKTGGIAGWVWTTSKKIRLTERDIDGD